MKKYIKITLIVLLIIVIAISGLLFTQAGNDVLKPFIKAELEKQTDQPVEISHFKLRYDHTVLKIMVNNALNVDIDSIFNLLKLTFDGHYKVFANNFIYNNITLDQANINGEFKGVPDNVYVNGKGSSFNAPLNYYLRILKGDAKEITINLKEMDLSDILKLAKQPAMAKGKVDANITIPTLVKGELNVHGTIDFNDVNFNDDIMKKVYKVSMPEAMQMNGTVDANLTDTEIMGGVKLQSDIANVDLKNVQFNRETKYLSSNYIVDIINLKTLSQLLHTKLDGALVLEGKVEKEKTLNVTGLTRSLGGEINYQVLDNNLSASLVAVPVKKLLNMFRFPAFVDAQASGDLEYDLLDKKGNTKLALKEFKLASNTITKSVGMMIMKDPSSIVFGETSLDADIDGDTISYSLIAKALNASVTIGEGKIDKRKDTNEATIEFAYNQYAAAANIEGSLRNPTIGFDTKGLLPAQMPNMNFNAKPNLDGMAKIEREIRKFFKRLF